MRLVLTALLLFAEACTRGQIAGADGGSPADVSVAGEAGSAPPDGRQVSDGVFRQTGPVDAPASGCSPAAGCGDAGTCWQTPAGDFQCVWLQARPTSPGGGCFDAGPLEGPVLGACCTRDEECTGKPRGRCVYDPNCGGINRPPRRHCDYGGWCTSDRECTSGTCTPVDYSGLDVPACLSGPCRTSADCRLGPGGVCMISGAGGPCGRGYSVYFCQYANDICQYARHGSDCPPNPSASSGQDCVPNADGQGTHCAQHISPPP